MYATKNQTTVFPLLLRRGLLAWLAAAAVEYALLPPALRDLAGLQGLRAMSAPRMGLVAGVLFALLWVRGRRSLPGERWGIPVLVGVLGGMSLGASFSWPYLGAVGLLLALALVYALQGWNSQPAPSRNTARAKGAVGVLGFLALGFFLLVGAWTASRYLTFSTPSFDLGIFAQMFHRMKVSGLPVTTIERDGELSHLLVHMSPIYYLLLPLYWLFPSPVTLQLGQAAVMASAVIPLWLLGREHGLSPWSRVLVCGMLLLFPAFAGGAGYDLHENCFLTPLIFWLLYGLDRKHGLLTFSMAGLVLLVKEDAAVYSATVGLYVLVRSLLAKDRRGLWLGGGVLLLSLGYFVWVTGFLARCGDGVMTYRYSNFLFDGGDSLATVVLAVLLCPMKAVSECVDPEKLSYLLWTMLPLLGLPLLTRRYERFLLLIPYVLVNLMSDYPYQHHLMYQYAFGSGACLIYLAAVNLAELQLPRFRRLAAAGLLAACVLSFSTQVLPTALYYPRQYLAYQGWYQNLETFLDQIPAEASVAASTFYTAHLAQREVLYDVRYSSQEHLLETEYVVLALQEEASYRAYGGYEGLTALLESKGYQLFASLEDALVIYRKSP